MKNIHLFETKKTFDAAKSDLILPRVAYITEKQNVKYNPTFDANGHDFVEIAGIKWATMNVGASGVTDYGCLYFQWGDTQGYTKDEIEKEHKKKFASDWSDYNADSDFKKYNETGKTELELVDDSVHANWGGSWRMPTNEEFECLLDAVDTEWKTDYQGNGVNGLLCTANDGSGKTLFFPACGDARLGNLEFVGDYFFYWSILLYSGNKQSAYAFELSNESVKLDIFDRYYGFPVRGVLDEK